eukprot:TRINITY_DN18735_c0_g1_i1.p1 TRINITY_DN18735_c0_g1~~TRINITY_DN18735_c0_g1_i1.p1  ORF type:complete len:196 (+),score=38.58 TRINITY_DN18735_c0_g1_i1:211-798(+)
MIRSVRLRHLGRVAARLRAPSLRAAPPASHADLVSSTLLSPTPAPVLASSIAPGQCHLRPFQHKTFEDVKREGGVKVAATNTWESRRYFLAKDNVPFSFHHTILYKGKRTLIWYKHHYEAVFVIKGSGKIEVLDPNQQAGDGTVHELKVGDAYSLDDNDRHFLYASPHEDMEVICAFSPALRGDEDHDEDGAYLP